MAHLYRDHVRFVWRTARFLGVSEADIEDVVHEVFVVIQRRRSTYNPTQSLRAWLAGVTRNVTLHYHRSRTRAQRKHRALAEDLPVDRGVSDPDHALSAQQAAQTLSAFLDQLDPAKREVFVLSDLQELSGPEIADGLGIKLNTVYARLRAARLAFDQLVARQSHVRRREGG